MRAFKLLRMATRQRRKMVPWYDNNPTRQMLQVYDNLRNWHTFRVRLFLEGILVGIATGLVISLFRFLLMRGNALRLKFYAFVQAGLTEQDFVPMFLLFATLLVMAGVSTALVRWEPMASGSGIAQCKGVILGIIHMRWLRLLVAKMVASVLSICGGLSLGSEDPSIHMGAVTGQGVGRLLGRNKMETRYLITAGAGSGLAAALNVPLAGVLFALEELHRNVSGAVLLPAMAASLTATVVSRSFFGRHTILSFYGVPALPLRYIPYVMLVAAVVALIGLLFNYGILHIHKFYQMPLFKGTYSRIAFAFVLAGMIGFNFPELQSSGGAYINFLAQHRPAVQALVGVLAGKFIFTIISRGSGSPGGFLLPMMAIGAIAGATASQLLIGWGLLPVEYGSNIIVISIVAMMASSVRVPITGAVLVMEMTGSYEHIMTLIIAAAVAFITAEILGGSPIYDSLLEKIVAERKPQSKVQDSFIVEVPVRSGSTLENSMVKAVKWPPKTLLVNIKRGGQNLIPTGDTVLVASDYIYVLTDNNHSAQVMKLGEEILPNLAYGDY